MATRLCYGGSHWFGQDVDYAALRHKKPARIFFLIGLSEEHSQHQRKCSSKLSKPSSADV
jgi:hypothetical protein